MRSSCGTKEAIKDKEASRTGQFRLRAVPWAKRLGLGASGVGARGGGAVVRFDMAHLEVAVAVVGARGVHTVLIGDDLRPMYQSGWAVRGLGALGGRSGRGGADNRQAAVGIAPAFPRAAHLPELGADLVTALAGLDVNDLAHGRCGGLARTSEECGLAQRRPGQSDVDRSSQRALMQSHASSSECLNSQRLGDCRVQSRPRRCV